MNAKQKRFHRFKGRIDMEVYPFLMKSVVMPTVGFFTNISIWEEFKRMMKTERLSSDALGHLQFSKLKKILKHAYETVPFYTKRFDAIGFRPDDIKDEQDIASLPPTTKDDIMQHFPDEITAQGMDRSEWKYVATSGTTRQIMGIHDFRKANINWAAGLRAHKLAGNHDIGKKWMEIPPHMCTNICGVNDTQEDEKSISKEMLKSLIQRDFASIKKQMYEYAHKKRQDLYKRMTLPSFGSEGTNIPEQQISYYLDAIEKYEPYLLEGLPLYLYAFAKYLLEKGVTPPKVGVIKPFGGSLTYHMKKTISEAFDCEVYDTYGCSETGFIACDCDKHEGLHLFMDLYHVDVCRNGKRVAPGEIGRLYITDLENSAMPWIKYDIGDVGRYFIDDHGCGRKSMRLQIEGRVQDTLSNAKGELFTSDQIFDFFHGFHEIDNFQLMEKEKGRFELLCVPANNAFIDKEKFSSAFRNFFDDTATIKVYVVKTIKAEDGGKFRFIKSKSFTEI